MTTVIFQPLTLADVKVRVEYLPEDLPVRGNYIQSDDEEADKRYEDEVIARLDRGDVLAWCVVEVSVHWRGYEGVAYLGAGSYDSEEDFVKGNSDYYNDLCLTALDNLNKELQRVWNIIGERFQSQ